MAISSKVSFEVDKLISFVIFKVDSHVFSLEWRTKTEPGLTGPPIRRFFGDARSCVPNPTPFKRLSVIKSICLLIISPIAPSGL